MSSPGKSYSERRLRNISTPFNNFIVNQVNFVHKTNDFNTNLNVKEGCAHGLIGPSECNKDRTVHGTSDHVFNVVRVSLARGSNNDVFQFHTQRVLLNVIPRSQSSGAASIEALVFWCVNCAERRSRFPIHSCDSSCQPSQPCS